MLMLFTLPDNTISEIIGYAFNFFDSIKIYIFLAMGVGLGLLILGVFYELFFSYGADVKRTARHRIADLEEEEDVEEFEEDVEEKMTEMLLED